MQHAYLEMTVEKCMKQDKRKEIAKAAWKLRQPGRNKQTKKSRQKIALEVPFPPALLGAQLPKM